MLGVLMALVIIFILYGQSYFKQNATTGKTQAETYIDRGKGAACSIDRSQLKNDIAGAVINNSGQLPSIKILVRKFGAKSCPGEGVFQLDDRGNVYCTDHAPAPESVSVSDFLRD